MIKVRLIHSVNLSLRNGACAVIRSLLERKNQFAINGIIITPLSPVENNDVYSANSIKKKLITKIQRCIKSRLTYFAQKNGLAAAVIMYITALRNAKKIVLKYIDSNMEEQDDVVFFHTIYTCYYYLKLSEKCHPSTLVLHNNGETFRMYCIYYKALEKSSFYKKMLEHERFVFSNVDRIVFVAKSAKENFLALHPEVDPRKVFYIHNGIDNIEAKPIKDVHKAIEICCVASITNRKGQRFIIEALKRYAKGNLPNVHFTLVGDGKDRKKLEIDVINSSLQDYVTFIGVSTKVDDYLRRSDIYILPSEDEGLPIAIIEAMRAYLPIVSTPVGGIPEMIIHGETGLLIEPSTEAIVELLDHISEYNWKDMGEKSHALFIERFTLEKMVDSYSKLLIF